MDQSGKGVTMAQTISFIEIMVEAAGVEPASYGIKI